MGLPMTGNSLRDVSAGRELDWGSCSINRRTDWIPKEKKVGDTHRLLERPPWLADPILGVGREGETAD